MFKFVLKKIFLKKACFWTLNMHYSLDFHRKIIIFFLNRLICPWKFIFFKKKIIFIDRISIFMSKTVLSKFCCLVQFSKVFDLKIEIWSIKMIFFLKKWIARENLIDLKKKLLFCDENQASNASLKFRNRLFSIKFQSFLRRIWAKS